VFVLGGEDMAYKPIEIDRQNLTIMGIRFSDIDTLNSTANAIGSNMFEGFEPTPRSIEIMKIENCTGKFRNIDS